MPFSCLCSYLAGGERDGYIGHGGIRSTPGIHTTIPHNQRRILPLVYFEARCDAPKGWGLESQKMGVVRSQSQSKPVNWGILMK